MSPPSPRTPSPRTRAIAFVAYLAGIPVAGCVLAYPLHLALAAAGVEDVEFGKLVKRSMEFVAIAGLWPLLVALAANDRRAWGVASAPLGFLTGMARGYAAGAAMLVVVVVVLVALGVRAPNPEFEWGAATLVLLLGKAIGGSIVIAAKEEIWHRGGLWGALERAAGAGAAIVATSLLYALVHFLRWDVAVDAAEVGWGAGFVVFAGSFGGLADSGIVDSFVALAAVGVLLALVRERTGRIAECIGLHAGWVGIIYLAKKGTVLVADAPAAALVGGYDGIIGWLVAAWFVVLAAAYRLRAGAER